MVSNYIKAILLLCGVSATAQTDLFVKDNTYMFVTNEHVYVKNAVRLDAANSNIYLRNDGQLLQGTTGAGANAGLGNLSVYQEGTVNNYLYNYWCSPVGNVLSDTSANNPFGAIQLKDVTGLTTAIDPVLMPTARDGIASPLSIATRWIYTFSVSNAYAQWAQIGSANTIAAGLGFTMKGTDAGNQRYDFRGKPNDGTITHAVSNNNFTLVGNPYPSAIDLNMFLGKDGPGPDLAWGTGDDIGAVNNPNINGTAYFWEHVNVASHYINQYQGGYGKYTPAGGYLRADIWSYNADGTQNTDLDPDADTTTQDGTNFERRFSPIGQGFMVMGNGVGATVSMQNKFRVFVKEGAANLSQFAKTNSRTASEFFDAIPNVAGTDYTQQKREGYAPQIRIKTIVNSNQGIIRTALGFGTGFTDGFDRAADAQATSDSAPYSFYNVLEGTDKEFAMSFSGFDIDKGYPVGFRNNEQATFRLKAVDFLYGFDPNQMVYIHDKQNNTYHNIKTSEFQITLPAGNVKDRFEITFKDAALSVKEDISSQFNIFQNNSNSMLTISNPSLFDIKSCILFDVTGKTIFKKDNLGNNSSFEFSTTGLSQAVYIVKLTTKDNQEITKKVAITNVK